MVSRVSATVEPLMDAEDTSGSEQGPADLCPVGDGLASWATPDLNPRAALVEIAALKRWLVVNA